MGRMGRMGNWQDEDGQDGQDGQVGQVGQVEESVLSCRFSIVAARLSPYCTIPFAYMSISWHMRESMRLAPPDRDRPFAFGCNQTTPSIQTRPPPPAWLSRCHCFHLWTYVNSNVISLRRAAVSGGSWCRPQVTLGGRTLEYSREVDLGGP